VYAARRSRLVAPRLRVATAFWAVDGQRNSPSYFATVGFLYSFAEMDDLNDGHLPARITSDGFGAKRIVQHASTMFVEGPGDKMSRRIEKSLGANRGPLRRSYWASRPSAIIDFEAISMQRIPTSLRSPQPLGAR
jgi:hypothetical protein